MPFATGLIAGLVGSVTLTTEGRLVVAARQQDLLQRSSALGQRPPLIADVAGVADVVTVAVDSARCSPRPQLSMRSPDRVAVGVGRRRVRRARGARPSRMRRCRTGRPTDGEPPGRGLDGVPVGTRNTPGPCRPRPRRRRRPPRGGSPDGWKPLIGQVALVPLRVSATSQAPAEARQTVEDGLEPVGQAGVGRAVTGLNDVADAKPKRGTRFRARLLRRPDKDWIDAVAALGHDVTRRPTGRHSRSTSRPPGSSRPSPVQNSATSHALAAPRSCAADAKPSGRAAVVDASTGALGDVADVTSRGIPRSFRIGDTRALAPVQASATSQAPGDRGTRRGEAVGRGQLLTPCRRQLRKALARHSAGRRRPGQTAGAALRDRRGRRHGLAFEPGNPPQFGPGRSSRHV